MTSCLTREGRPFAGAVYVLERQRVHPVNVPFTDAIRVVSRWGSGAKTLVAAMERRESIAPANSAVSELDPRPAA